MIYRTVLALGDSLTYGARCEGSGWCDLLPGLLPDMETAVLNRGICGETTWQIAQRAPAAVRELAALPGDKVMVLWAGTNDSKGAPPLDVYARALDAILHWPRRYGMPVALATLPPVAPGTMHAFSERSQGWIHGANALLHQVARDRSLPLIPGSRLEPAHLIDGVHLNAEGHRLFASWVAEALVRGWPA